MISKFYLKLLFKLSIVYFVSIQAETKRIKPAQVIKCYQEECDLSYDHLRLYSYIKRSIESDFDLKGKEIFPLLISVDLLRLRFSQDNQHDIKLNGSKTVLELLANDKLNEALKTFQTDEGQSLIDFYRGSINGKNKNLACQSSRVKGIERIGRKLDSSLELKKIFGNIHKRYVKESAKKCLGSSCDFFDGSMSHMSYIVGDRKQKDVIHNRYIESPDYNTNVTIEMRNEVRFDIKLYNQSREFEKQELELCRFFSKSNITDCMISAKDLKDIDFADAAQSANITEGSKMEDFLREYFIRNLALKVEPTKTNEFSENELNQAKVSIVSQCKQIRPVLDSNLMAINWYRKNGYIENKQFIQRTSWCPGLSYWIQIDRLCGQLEGIKKSKESVESEETFVYEVSNNV